MRTSSEYASMVRQGKCSSRPLFWHWDSTVPIQVAWVLTGVCASASAMMRQAFAAWSSRLGEEVG